MKAGEHVHLRFRPETRGTISKVCPDGRFLVTWVLEDRKPRESRARFWYTQEDRVNIRPGVPA